MPEPGSFHPPEEAGESLAEASGQQILLETYYGTEGLEAFRAADGEPGGFRRT